MNHPPIRFQLLERLRAASITWDSERNSVGLDNSGRTRLEGYADAMLDLFRSEPVVGVEWCPIHNGVRNEDASHCDRWIRDGGLFPVEQDPCEFHALHYTPEITRVSEDDL